MSRKVIVGVVTGVVVLALLVMSMGGRMSLVSQIVESDKHRTIEYGLLGSSFPVRSETVPDLVVSNDVMTHLGSVAPFPPGLNAKKPDMTMRIRRPSNSEWFASMSYTGNHKDIVAYYQKHLKPTGRPPHADDVEGELADGTNVWIYFDTANKRASFKFTKPERGLDAYRP